MFTVNCIEKTKKEKDAGTGPLKKDKIERGTLSKEKQNPNLDGCCVHKTVILHTANALRYSKKISLGIGFTVFFVTFHLRAPWTDNVDVHEHLLVIYVLFYKRVVFELNHRNR